MLSSILFVHNINEKLIYKLFVVLNLYINFSCALIQHYIFSITAKKRKTRTLWVIGRRRKAFSRETRELSEQPFWSFFPYEIQTQRRDYRGYALRPSFRRGPSK